MPSERRPRFMGRQVWPASSVRNTPAAEIAMNIRLGSLGSRMMVCRHIPPAPGCQDGPDGWPRSPGRACNGRPLDMINLPAPKVGAADVPPLATAVRGHDERALARANQ